MSAEVKRPLKVFLCHATADKPAVRALYRRLVRDGVDAWLDKEKLFPGQDWQLEIPKAVRESDIVVVCLSKNSITKEGYVQKEIKFALDIAAEKPEGTIFVIPARLEECDVPSRLGLWQWVDLFEADGYERLMRSLRLRADKLGLRVGDTTYTDKELEQRLEQLYTEGLAALWVEDWDKAYHRFQTILHERPDHMQAVAKLEEATRQKHLNALYAQALDAQQNENWQAAVELLGKLTSEEADYKDASLLLKNAQKKNQLAHLYEEARKLYKAQQWQAVVRVFAQIAAIEPNYQDPDGVLSQAEMKVAELERLDKLGKLYNRAVREIDAGHWHEAHGLLKQIQVDDPGFQETERLLTKVETEVKKAEEKHWREDQINALYEQARELVRGRIWREVLTKIHEIRKLDETFADPDQIAKQAQNELEREEQEIERKNKLTAMYTEAVGLLREKKYQDALEKWREIFSLDPKYPDQQKVEVTSKKKLAQLTRPLQSRPRVVNLKQVGIVSSLVITLAIIIWGSSQFLPIPGFIDSPTPSPLDATESPRPSVSPALSPVTATESPRPSVSPTSSLDTPESQKLGGGTGQIFFNCDAQIICVMSTDGLDQIQLTTGGGNLGVSPDGSRIAFENYSNHQIYVMSADGSGLTQLKNTDGSEPDWSPDGAQIVFQSDRDGDNEIYVMNSDGTGQTQLTSNSAAEKQAAWSPDGKRIAFVSNRDGNPEIYVMNSDGTGQQQLTDSQADNAFPDWSPDSKRILFDSNDAGNYDIYIINANGRGLIRITNNLADDDYPSWSPDGMWIVFDSKRDGNWEIYIMKADGTGERRLTNSSLPDYGPAWQP